MLTLGSWFWLLFPFIFVPFVGYATLRFLSNRWNEFEGWRNLCLAMILICLCSLSLLLILLPGIICLLHSIWWAVSLICVGWIYLTYRFVFSFTF